MPTYDYICDQCGHRFEVFQSITEKSLKRCPECQGSVKRLIGPGAGLIFKGSGFYITDYKHKESGSASTRSGTQNKTEPGSKSEPKSDGKAKDGGGEGTKRDGKTKYTDKKDGS